MTKQEAKEKIEVLYKALNEYIDKSDNMRIIKLMIVLSKTSDKLEYYQECVEAVREIKKLNKQDEYIKGLCAFDIHEALGISEVKAEEKIKKYNFTYEEKEQILYYFMGGVRLFVKNKLTIC